MLKIISKVDCKRCEEIKRYLDGRLIPYEVEMAEDRGYEYWRDFVRERTGMLGFPILGYSVGEGAIYQIVNGGTEEIINKINEWYPNSTDYEGKKSCDQIHYDWAICSCGYKGKDFDDEKEAGGTKASGII